MFRQIKELFSTAKKPAKNHPKTLQYEELEPRVLFSADFVPGLDDIAVEEQVLVQDIGSDFQVERKAAPETVEQTAAEARWELAFVSEDVADYGQLIADLQGGDNSRIIEVVVLEADRDGIEQVSEILSNRSGLAAVHFITHGADGQINLGNSRLNSTTLAENSDAVAGWGKALTETGDILFYGCNVAADGEGQSLLDNIGELTRADVIASDDLTGNAALGGDWELEYTAGKVETSVAISHAAQQTWSGVLSTYTVSSTVDSGAGSLRQAIIDANANANSGGPDLITFDIGADGSQQTINLLSALDPISESVIIDGFSQYGALTPTVPVIEINGAGAINDGLSFASTSDGSIVQGVMITGFSQFGIQVDSGVDGITILGNWIGTTGTGYIGVGNYTGINVQGVNTIIGGTGANDGNVITNNSNEGINITGSGATGTIIKGNIIGLDPDGDTGTGNGDVGIALLSGADNTTIGGITEEARNIISNNYEGIEINSNNNTVQGNYIGTDITGTFNRGNDSDDGIEIQNSATGNLIGGTAEGAGNLIAFNFLDGVNIVSGSGNAVLGNDIHSNGDQDIDLGAGANSSQTAPALSTAAAAENQILITGSLSSAINDFYRIEFFADTGGIQTYIGYANVATDGTGNATIDATLNASVAVGASISATATNSDASYTTFSDSSELGASTVAVAANDAPTFSVGDGIVTTAIGLGDDDGRSVTVQSDGKILVAGRSFNGSDFDFALVRYDADGTLDTSFSSDGMLTTAIGAGEDVSPSVAVQPDGKILMAGRSFNGTNFDFALVRYNADGTLDTSFSGDGMLTTAVGSGDDISSSVTVQADGKILVAGRSHNGSDLDFALVRYNADGTPDTSFDSDGIVTTDFGPGDDRAFSVVVQPDGKILVAGDSDNGSNIDFALARYNADGSLDTSFDGNGRLITDFGSSVDRGYSVALQADGKIVVAGRTGNGLIDDFALARYNADGTLDTSFDGDGLLATAVSAGLDYGRSVTLQPDGKILVAGQSYNGSNNDFAVLRLNADGTLDTSFGGDGMFTAGIGSGDDIAFSITVQPDGKILAAGQSHNGSNNDFAVLRLNADGTLDTAFDVGNPVKTLDGAPTFVEDGPAVVLDADVDVSDAELDALNGGLGNYAGASLTLVRNGGAVTEDVFAFNDGNGITLSGGNLIKNAQIIASFDTVTTPGELVVSFTDANGEIPVSADVDNILRQITYANSSDSPPASAQIDWTFDDGNTGDQGTGGALQATGSTTVSITAVNDAPTFIDGSVGNWNFDEGSGDSIVESAIGISTGTLGSTAGADANDPTWTTGKFGQALHFDGVNDYIEIADAPGIDISGPQFSASLWMNPDSGPNQEDMLFMKGDRQGNINYYLSWKDSGKMTWAFKDSAGWHYQDMPVTMPTTGQWNHIGITFDRPTVSLYVNGTKYVFDDDATGGSMDRDLTANDEVLWIGAGRDAGALVGVNQWSGPFTGSIDELALFDRALTDAEIEAIRTSTPPAVTASAFSIDENSANNTVVGTVVANDQDIGDTLSYAITAGNTGGAFSIDANGQIKVANSAALDFETNPTFNLTIEATDDGIPSLSDTTTVTISLNDVNDAPVAQNDGVHLSFDGDDFIQVADDASLQMTNNFTIEAWINHDGTGTGSKIIVNKEGEYEVGITEDTGEIKFAIANQGSPDNWAWHNTGYFVTIGEWTHVAVTYDGVVGEAKTYINGELVDTFAQSGVIGDVYPALNDLWIGGRQNDPDDRFTGQIDEVRVWGITRTQGEIQANMDGQLTGGETGLAGNWRLDEAFGTVAIDQSTSGNDGVLGGSEGVAATPTYQGYFISEDSLLTVPAGAGLLANDFDADGDALSVTNVDTTGMLGSLVVNTANGSFTYDPRGVLDSLGAGERLSETFTYTANDGSVDSSPVMVTITVVGANDAPVASGNTVSTNEDTAKNFAVADFSFTDVEADALASVQITNLSLNGGTLTHSGATTVNNGDTLTAAQIDTLVYTPPADQNGNGFASFDYSVNDTGSGTATAAMTIDVTAVNDDPTTTGIADVTVNENAPNTEIYLFDAFADTEDADANLTYTITSNTNQGLFSTTPIDSGTGILTLDYAPNANGTASITVRATDTGGLSVETTLLVTVNAVNVAPVATAEVYSVNEDSSLVVDWWNTYWTARQQLTFNNLAQTENLVDFPVLVKLNLDNIDYAKTQDNGEDLRFLDADGTALAHEIETWNEAGDSYVWVKVPQINSASTTDSISMYYGNAAAVDAQDSASVWSDGFEAVYHLKDDFIDSTANTNDGTNFGSTDIAGNIGDGQDFDAIDDHINVGSDASLDDIFEGGGTVSAWIYPTGWGQGNFGRIFDKANDLGGNRDGWALDLYGSGNEQILFQHGFSGGIANWLTPTGSIKLNTWQQIIVVYDSSSYANDPMIYINGVAQTVTELNTPTGTQRSDADLDLQIGGYVAPDNSVLRTFDGIIDEARLSNTAYSADWVAAQYASTTNAFVSFGTEETAPAIGGVTTNDTDTDGDFLSASIVSGPSNAAAFTFNVDGTFTYTPDLDFFGTDSFTYKVNDGTSDSNTATVTITVNPVNDAPTATNLNAAETYTEDMALNLTDIVISDVDSANVTATLTLSDTAAGSLSTATSGAVTSTFLGGVWTASGVLADVNSLLASVTFTPALNYNSNFTIATSVDDGVAPTVTGVKSITGTAVNDAAPVATDDTYSVDEDNTLTADWWNTAWTRRQELTFDNAAQAETLTDFPVLVILNSSNIDYAQTKDDGSDLRFFAADGTPLAYEIEQWNEGGDSSVWVRVPQITGNSNSDIIWMYYGNDAADSGEAAEGVWDSNFVGVWHLNEEQIGTGTSGVYKDSTSIGNNGIDRVAATGQDGVVTDGQEFGANDWIEIAHDPSLDLTDSMTISFWIKPTSNSGTFNRVVEKGLWGYQNSYYFGGGNGINDLTFYLNGQMVIDTADDVLTVGEWQHAAVSYTSIGDGTGTARLYLDGVEIATGNYTSGNVLGNTGRLAFGHSVLDYDFDGFIDEVQISDTDRSADWIAAQYQATKNQLSDKFVHFGGEESAPAVGGVLSNDTDVDGDPLTVSLVDGPDNAQSFTLNKDGTFIYTPTADYAGSDTFTYEVSDGNGGTAQATATITINPVNDAPILLTGSINNLTVNEDSGLTSLGLGSVTYGPGGGSDESAQNLNYDVTVIPDSNFFGKIYLADGTTQVTTGSYTLAEIQGMQFAPNANENGISFFSFNVQDDGGTGNGGSDILGQSIQITVNAANDAPVITSAAAVNAAENQTAVSTVTATDADADTPTFTITGGADQGLFSITAGGVLTFNSGRDFEAFTDADNDGVYEVQVTADDGHSGSDVQTILVTVTDVNEAPSLVTLSSTNVDENTDTSGGYTVGSLTTTDQDAGDTTSYSINGGADAGVFSISGSDLILTDGLLDFETKASYEVTVRITDSGDLTHDQTFTITVSDVNDNAPVIGGTTTGTVVEDGTLNANGTLTISDVDVSDNPISFPDEAIILGDNGYGDFVLTGGTWTYTLNNAHTAVQALDVGESLTDTHIFTASDGSTQLVTMTINGAEDAPVLGGVTAGAVTEDGALTASDEITITDVDTADNPVNWLDEAATAGDNGYGTFQLTGGTWTYTLNNAHAAVQALDVGESLTDTHIFTASDGSTQLVTMTINGAENAPIALDDAVSGDEDTVITGNVLTNDTDTETDPLTANLVSGPAHGSLTLRADGSFSYTPDADWNGTDTFTYTANDGALDSNVATMTITVNPVNDAPSVSSSAVTAATENAAYSYTITANDIDGDDLTITASTLPAWLTLVDNGDGTATLSGTPTNADVGEHSVELDISDGELIYLQDFTLTVSGETIDPPVDDPDPDLRGSTTPDPELFEGPETDDEQDPDTEAPTQEDQPQDPVIEAEQAAPIVEDLTTQDSAHADDQLVIMPDPQINEEILYLTDDDDMDSQAEERDDDPSITYYDNDLYKDLSLSKYVNINYTAADGSNLKSEDDLNILYLDSDDQIPADVNGDYDLHRQQIDESFDIELKSQETKAKIVSVTAASFAAGFVSYLLRAGSLVANLMSTLPLWRGFDPIVIFSGNKKKKKKDRNEIPDTNEAKSETLFDDEVE